MKKNFNYRIIMGVGKAWFSDTKRAGFACAHTAPYIKFGFTLAEVLVTLGIIGIVAAMTLPALINNYKHLILQTQFKTANALLQNVFLSIRVENPNLYSDLKSYGSNYGALNILKPLLTEQFKKSGDFGKDELYNAFSAKYVNFYNAATSPNIWGNYGQFALANGMLLYTECSGACNYIHVFVDINGTKAPNRNVHDLFDFELNSKNQLVPSTQFGKDCNRAKTDQYAGFDCTAQAIYDKDYFKKLP